MTDGLFSVQLGSLGDAISAAVFNGGGDRYLQVWVCTSAGAGCVSYDDMGRLPISSGAYAQTLSLPAYLEKSDASVLLAVNNTGSGRAISGQTTGDVALYGVASGASGTTYGVYGQSPAHLAAACMALPLLPADRPLAYSARLRAHPVAVSMVLLQLQRLCLWVYGQCNSTNGRGVYCLANVVSGTNLRGVRPVCGAPWPWGVWRCVIQQRTTFGVQGQAHSPYGSGVVRLGYRHQREAYGVQGRSDSSDGRGVYGWAAAHRRDNHWAVRRVCQYGRPGVFGYASATSGGTYGVRGESAQHIGTRGLRPCNQYQRSDLWGARSSDSTRVAVFSAYNKYQRPDLWGDGPVRQHRWPRCVWHDNRHHGRNSWGIWSVCQ